MEHTRMHYECSTSEWDFVFLTYDLSEELILTTEYAMTEIRTQFLTSVSPAIYHWALPLFQCQVPK